MNPDDAQTIVPKTDATFTPPSDPSQYMRTYAKDVAMLTNSPAPAPVAAPVKPQATGTDDVVVPEYDASPVNHSDNPSSPKEFKSEVVALSKDDSEGIFNSSKEKVIPHPLSMMPQATIGVTSNVPPVGSALSTNTPPEDTAPEREAILARLRAKLASHTPASVPTPAPIPEPVVIPVPPAPEPQPVQTPIPVVPPSAPTPEPVVVTPEPPVLARPQFVPPPEPPLNPLPVREPIPVPQPIARPVVAAPQPAPLPVQRAEAGPSPIHTFSSDFSDRIDSQGASTFSVLAAQSDARPGALAPKKRGRLIPVIAGIVILLCGIGVVTGAYIYSTKGTKVPVIAGVPSLITFDESVEVKGSGASLMHAIADVAGQTSVAGNVIVTYLTAPGATGGAIPQPGGTLISALPLNAPDILLRNIDQSSTVGVIRAGSESRPFLVLRVNSYERTFAGMLAWEPNMAAALGIFYPAYTDSIAASVATTSSSSAAVPAFTAPASPFFNDAVVVNHDVRILRDARGRSLMLYGYQGKDTLLIARDEAAFTALIARLSATPAQ